MSCGVSTPNPSFGNHRPRLFPVLRALSATPNIMMRPHASPKERVLAAREAFRFLRRNTFRARTSSDGTDKLTPGAAWQVYKIKCSSRPALPTQPERRNSNNDSSARLSWTKSHRKTRRKLIWAHEFERQTKGARPAPRGATPKPSPTNLRRLAPEANSTDTPVPFWRCGAGSCRKPAFV